MVNRLTSHRGFTLVEVLIVLTLIALLAAIVVTQYGNPTRDAKESSLMSKIRTMRTQIELYKAHHVGEYPEIRGNDLPQLTHATDVHGEIGEPGPNYPLGPYLEDPLPANPFDDSNHVEPVARPGEEPAGAVGNLGGWQYDETTGAIWPNNPGYYTRRLAEAATQAVEL